ncbi:hypothetical protein [Litchfieldia salsa]|uniref:Uncharacterized protein n=1 Tax=Litchfieldia salsa TaxID=930152 RepID=A0A1H0VBL3_9BACI|nr:hypothetical protein [Litchfieldia salsa]SDP75810.1 hypothetical protein SAMN05216565_106165 [Litchfieldia salsa]
MELAIITLLGLAIVLLVFSFFKRDSIKDLEEQVEELSMSLIQETYQLKKKISVLEEELLMDEPSPFKHNFQQSSSGSSHSSLEREKISSLFQSQESSDLMDSNPPLKMSDEAYFLEQIRKRGEQNE